MIKRRFVHVLFALSGASALIYQVVWVRQLGLVFGTTVHAAAAVLAVFLGGMGLGAWLAGRWIDGRPASGVRAYALAELWIAGWGLLLAWVLPALPAVAASWTVHTVGADGWWAAGPSSHLLRLAMTSVLLAPSTLAMGATLTLLTRHLVATPQTAGIAVGWLYGANTLGAALGALAGDLWAIPALGLVGTQVAAVLLNLTAGIGALWLALPASAAPSEPDPRAPWPQRAALTLMLTGFAAMGLELVWFRFLAGALGPYREVVAVVLAIVLVGLALGSAGAATLLAKGFRPASTLAGAQTLLVLAALGGLALFDPEDVLHRQLAVADRFLAGGPWVRSWLVHRVNGVTIAGLVLLPSIAMGAAFPLANALAHDRGGRVGRRTGQLTLATTAGNVAGSLGVGFVALPTLGLQGTALLLGVVAWVAGIVPWPRGSVAWVALAAAGLGLIGFGSLPADHLLWRTFPANRAKDEGVLEVRDGLEQLMVVTGTVEGPARLWTSGHPMTSTSDHAQRYMRLMAHLPLLLDPDATRALVIAFGAGNTTHAASLHPLPELHVADLSRDVLQLAPHFAHSNQGVLGDPRVTVFVEDGRHHLWQQPEGYYDLITLEPPPLSAVGVSSLYATEFYALARSRLAPGGQLAQWLPAYQVPEEDVSALVRAFVDVFPEAVLLMGSARELVLLGSDRRFDPEAVAAVLDTRPEVAADLERIGFGTPRELALTFLADGQTLRAAVADVRPLTDDRPTLEHAQASHLQQTRLPAALFDPAQIGRWCPACVEDPILMGWMDVTAAAVRSEAFLRFDSLGRDTTASFDPPDLSDRTLAAIVASDGLRRALRAPDALALRAVELWEAGEADRARAHLDAARAQAPGVDLLEQTARDWSP